MRRLVIKNMVEELGILNHLPKSEYFKELEFQDTNFSLMSIEEFSVILELPLKSLAFVEC